MSIKFKKYWLLIVVLSFIIPWADPFFNLNLFEHLVLTLKICVPLILIIELLTLVIGKIRSSLKNKKFKKKTQFVFLKFFLTGVIKQGGVNILNKSSKFKFYSLKKFTTNGICIVNFCALYVKISYRRYHKHMIYNIILT